MSAQSKRPSLQPRPTKASLLRTQQQQQRVPSSSVTPTMSGMASQVIRKELQTKQQLSPSTSTSVRYAATGPSAGVKAFMAQQRARLASNKPKATTASKDEGDQRQQDVSSRGRFMTGAEKYSSKNDSRYQREETDAALLGGAQRKLSIVIKQAKTSGKLDISSRSLTKIPEEVIKMYHVDPNAVVIDFNATGDAWYDMEELTKFIAADNQITTVDERIADEFGALKYIDFRDNQLDTLPGRLHQLQNLTSVFLQYNQFKELPHVLLQLQQLKELNLSHNVIEGCVDLENLQLEQLDLSHNRISRFNLAEDCCSTLTKLNISNNQIKQLPSARIMRRCKNLQELLVNRNRLKTLVTVEEDESLTLPSLVRLNANDNQITSAIVVSGCNNKRQADKGTKFVGLPKLVDLSLGTNKLHELDKDIETLLIGAPNIKILDISSNQFESIPDSTIDHLENVERLDVRGNQLRTLTYRLGKLSNLKVLHCEGNPMRAYSSISQAQLIESLRSNYQTQLEEADKVQGGDQQQCDFAEKVYQTEQEDVNFQEGAAQSLKPEIAEWSEGHHNVSLPIPPHNSATTKLDLSNKNLTKVSEDLIPNTDGNIPGLIYLNQNTLTEFPVALIRASNFIVELDLSHNRIDQFSLAMEGLILPNLKKLKINNNRLKIMNSGEISSFPKLVELDLSFNALSMLPNNFSELFPDLKSLYIGSNKLDNLTGNHFIAFKNLEILDMSNNDIGYLPPELSSISTLRQLIVFGNRFRVPRPAVVDQGTQAVLEFLKRRYLASLNSGQ